MQIKHVPFDITDWSEITRVTHNGATGLAHWQTQKFADIRVRMVEYTAGYKADHWCNKGHVLFCLEGELHTELFDGRTFTLTPGMSFQVADNAEPHRSYSDIGARLFVVD